MHRKIICLTIIYACTLLYTKSFAQVAEQTFPYSNAFTSMDGIVPMTGASHTVTVQNDRNGKAFGIKLTDGSIKDPQFSGIVFDRLSFSSKRGFSIQFEYSMFDGKKAYGEYGDGFALVLYDPKGLTNGIPDTGSAGSALGYGGVLNDKGEGAGLSNGYLGIAFDQFGNNKWRRNQPDKDKPNKSQYSTGIKRSSVDVTYYSPSFLTVRGPMHPTIGRKGGYPVLLAQATHNIIETNKGKNRAVLNSSTGGYDWFNNAPSKDFIIRGDKLTDNPKDTEYRKAYVELLPGVHKGKKGYYLNVSIQAGCDPSGKYNIYSMTDFYFMSTEDEIIYMELDSRDRTNDVKQRLRLTPPSVFNLGFTAATGAAYQTQVIKDVKIALPFSPQATDNVYSDVCNGRVGYFNPILNDVGYNTNIIVDRAMPEGKFEYLDLESFRFMKPDGKGVYHPAGTAPYHKLEAPGGTFHYDKNTGIITFVPKAPYFTKDEDLEYELYYDIKNKPSELTGNLLSHDDYRSPISKVTFEFQKCPSVIVNPHITSSPKIKKTVR